MLKSQSLGHKHPAAAPGFSGTAAQALESMLLGKCRLLLFSDFKLLHAQFQLQGRNLDWFALCAHLMPREAELLYLNSDPKTVLKQLPKVTQSYMKKGNEGPTDPFFCFRGEG